MSGLAAERIHARHPGAEHDSLRDVSLRVLPGEILVLLGANGSGKSTLLAALAGELRPRLGRVVLDGEDLAQRPPRARARRISRLPQEPLHPEGLRVAELVACGRYAHVGALGRQGPADRAAVREALSAMDLDGMRQRPLERLSGGERRRAWLAMVLAQQAGILLLDEPTAALDLRQQLEVLWLLQRVNREHGLTIVAAIHDIEQAAALAHRVAVMHRGRLYAVGPPERCLDEQTLRDVFGVDGRLEKIDGRLRATIVGRADPLRSL